MKKYRDMAVDGRNSLLLQTGQKLWVILAAGIRSHPGYSFQLSRRDMLKQISWVISENFKSGLAEISRSEHQFPQRNTSFSHGSWMES